MKEDGYRYAVSYTNDCDKLTIHESMQGGLIGYNAGKFTAFTIPTESVTSHAKYWVEALTRTNKPLQRVFKPHYHRKSAISIIESDHGCFTIAYGRQYAEVTPTEIKCTWGFSIEKAANLVGKIWSIVLTRPDLLKPKTDVLRYLSEYNLLIFYDGANTVVVDKDNTSGLSMQHCLINGAPYSNVLISVDEVQGYVAIHDFNFNQLCKFNLDNSVLKIFKDTNTLLKEEANLNECKYTT